MVARWIATLGVAVSLVWPSHAGADTVVYATGIDASFEKESDASAKQGVFMCEINLAIVKPPTGVNLRVKLLKNGKDLFQVATVDVGEFAMSNGIPYSPRKTPIGSVGIVSNIFETAQSTKQIDMQDGGMGIVLTVEQFGMLTALIVRGDYYVTYVARGTAETTALAVHDGVNAKVWDQFYSCSKKLLS